MNKIFDLDLRLFGAGENVNTTEGVTNTLTGTSVSHMESFCRTNKVLQHETGTNVHSPFLR